MDSFTTPFLPFLPFYHFSNIFLTNLQEHLIERTKWKVMVPALRVSWGLSVDLTDDGVCTFWWCFSWIKFQSKRLSPSCHLSPSFNFLQNSFFLLILSHVSIECAFLSHIFVRCKYDAITALEYLADSSHGLTSLGILGGSRYLQNNIFLIFQVAFACVCQFNSNSSFVFRNFTITYKSWSNSTLVY